MFHLNVLLYEYTVVLVVRFCFTFHVDQVCGVEMCRWICQQRDCCSETYNEKWLRCVPSNACPIVLRAGTAESTTCTVITRRVRTRTRGEQVVTDCVMENQDDLGQNVTSNCTLLEAYEKGDSCLVRYILTAQRRTVELEERDEDGFTVGMRAAFDGNKDMLKLLVREGSSLSVKNNDNQTSLILAVRNTENIDIVRYILRNADVDINSADKYGGTALLYSCALNDSSILYLLLAAGGNVSAIDNDGHGILFYACSSHCTNVSEYILTHYSIEEHESISNDVDKSLETSVKRGCTDLVDLLVTHGADLTIVESEGSSMLAVACKSRSVAMVEYVLSKRCVPVDRRNSVGDTPFLVAASTGSIQIMEVLLENGCNTSAVDDEGLNVLHCGCQSESKAANEYILKKGFINDINSITSDGLTALLVAACYNNTDVFDVLVDSKANMSAVDNMKRNSLHLACTFGLTNMVKHILQLSPDRVHIGRRPTINSKDEEGRTPLMEAAISGFIDVVDLLVSYGGDTNTTDGYGDTILHEAIRKGQVDMVEHILSKGYVNIERRGRYGYTPILSAAYYGDTQIFETIESSSDCDMQALDYYNDNIYHLACSGGNMDMVEYLFEGKYVNPDKKGWNDRTPVLLAAHFGHLEVVDYLMGLHCNMKAVDKQGNNALHLAILEEHRELAMYLIETNELDNFKGNKDGKTPFKLAVEKGYPDIADMLRF